MGLGPYRNISVALTVQSDKHMIYKYTLEPGYDIGLYDTPSIASDIVVPIKSSLLTITLDPSVITTPGYNDPKY
jgi:hypothetical protein